MLVDRLEVIWIHDEFIKPPGPKMVVCVEPSLGLFYRISTEGKWQIPILIEKSRNSFLHHNSYIECGSPLELDDYLIEQSISVRGIYGTVDAECLPRLCAAVLRSRNIRETDRAAILLALQCSVI